MAPIQTFLLSLEIFFASTFVALLIAKPAISIAKRLGIIDIPGASSHKKHKRPTPKAGGLILIVTVLTVLVVFGTQFSRDIFVILLCGSIVFLFGFLDDLKGLYARSKLAGQLLVAFILIISGIKVSILKIPGTELDEIVNLAITVVWIVGVTNAFNLVDSTDSLSVGLSMIASLFLLIGSLISLQEQLVLQAAMLLGVGIILLYFNLSPAELFLGDSGTQTLGFLLASFAILYSPQDQPQASSWFVPIAFFAVPIFDVCLVFFSRIRRGLPIYQADTNHTYHRLVARGLPHSRAVWLMDLMALIVGMTGLFALYQPPIIANVIFGGIVFAGLVAFILLEAKNT